MGKYGYIRWNHGNAYWHETEEQAHDKPYTRIEKIVSAEQAKRWWDAVNYLTAQPKSGGDA